MVAAAHTYVLRGGMDQSQFPDESAYGTVQLGFTFSGVTGGTGATATFKNVWGGAAPPIYTPGSGIATYLDGLTILPSGVVTILNTDTTTTTTQFPLSQLMAHGGTINQQGIIITWKTVAATGVTTLYVDAAYASDANTYQGGGILQIITTDFTNL